jgi:hypothetical protein
MRSLSSKVKAVAAVVAVLIIVGIASPVRADEPNPVQPPQARLQPPIGAMSSTPQPQTGRVIWMIAMWLDVLSI